MHEHEATSEPAQDFGELFRLGVDQYHELINANVLGPNDKVELLEGVLVRKMPKDPIHVVVTEILRELLAPFCGQAYCIRTQDPVTTSDSEPEPDVAVARGSIRQYLSRHPAGDEVALVIEVSNTTQKSDAVLKRRIYAAARYPLYWIVDTRSQTVNVLTHPTGVGVNASYERSATYERHQMLPVALPETPAGEIAVADLFPFDRKTP